MNAISLEHSERIWLNAYLPGVPADIDAGNAALPSYIEQMERAAIQKALEENRWNKTKAAAQLGIFITFVGCRFMGFTGPEATRWKLNFITAFNGLERLARLSALVIGGMAVYFATLFTLGFRVRDFRRRAAT